MALWDRLGRVPCPSSSVTITIFVRPTLTVPSGHVKFSPNTTTSTVKTGSRHVPFEQLDKFRLFEFRDLGGTRSCRSDLSERDLERGRDMFCVPSRTPLLSRPVSRLYDPWAGLCTDSLIYGAGYCRCPKGS